MIISEKELLHNFLNECNEQKLFVAVDDQYFNVTFSYIPIKEECNFICDIKDVNREIQLLLIQSLVPKARNFRVNVFHFSEKQDCLLMRTMLVKIIPIENPPNKNRYKNILPPRIEGEGKSRLKNIKSYESFDTDIQI